MKNSWIVAMACAAFALSSNAMRLYDIQEFATLTEAGVARSGDRACVVPPGTVVRILGQPTDPSDAAPTSFLFVRAVTGPCTGFGFTISKDSLTDFRETPQPSTP